MSDGEFVTLARYPDELRASVVRSQLEAAGFRTYLHGGQAATTLWHVGPALGGVELKVAAVDAQRAVDYLRNELGEATFFDQVDGQWLCRECGERIPPGMPKCPVCGGERDLVEELPRSHEITEEELTAAALADGEILEGDEADVTEEEDEVDHDAVALRAFRAAVFGLLFPPILVYAGLLAIQLPAHELSDRGRRHRAWATIIVVGAVVGLFALLSSG